MNRHRRSYQEDLNEDKTERAKKRINLQFGIAPSELYRRFDLAFGDGSVDDEAYSAYLDTVKRLYPPALGKYLELFSLHT